MHAATAVSDTSDNREENLPVRDDKVSRRPIQGAFRFTHDAHDVSYYVSFFNRSVNDKNDISCVS